MNPKNPQTGGYSGRGDDNNDKGGPHRGQSGSRSHPGDASPPGETLSIIDSCGGGDACEKHDHRGLTPLLEPEGEAGSAEADPAEPDDIGADSENENRENEIYVSHGAPAFAQV